MNLQERLLQQVSVLLKFYNLINTNLNCWHNQTKKAKEIEQLEKSYEELSKKRDELKASPELVKLITEQDKLRYRIKILEAVITLIMGLPETHTAKSEKHTKYRNAHNFGFKDSKS
jgi:hypothetical protein